MNEIVKKPEQPVDGVAAFDDSVQVEGDDEQRSPSLPGDRLKFTNEVRWVTREGADLTGRELLVVDMRRTEVKWGELAPLEVLELGPGDRYRDLEAVNATIPKSEWRKGPDGKLQGPWQRQNVLELVDPATMERFSWPTATAGGSKAINELRDRALLMRRFRGEGVYPVVALSNTFMKTKYGGRQRPHLVIKGWVRVSGGTIEQISPTPQVQLAAPTPPAPTVPVAPAPAVTPTAPPVPATPRAPAMRAGPTQPAPILQPVSEPTRGEERNDEIPFN